MLGKAGTRAAWSVRCSPVPQSRSSSCTCKIRRLRMTVSLDLLLRSISVGIPRSYRAHRCLIVGVQEAPRQRRVSESGTKVEGQPNTKYSSLGGTPSDSTTDVHLSNR